MGRKWRDPPARLVVLTTSIALAFVVLVAGCAPTRAAADLSSKEIVEVTVGELSARASANGQVLPQREALLSFGTPGRVTAVHADVGDAVRAGDILVEVDNRTLQRALRSAELALAIQEANLADLQEAASPEEIAAARASVASAQAQLDDLLSGPSDLELGDAQATLASAQAQLDELLRGPREEDLARARALLASAQAAERAEAARYAAREEQLTVLRLELDLAAADLESATYFYNALKNDWQHADYADVSPEAQRLKDAQAAYDAAKARYDLSAAGVSDSALRNARAQVAQAEANLASLTEDKTAQIASAREQVALAEVNLESLTEERTVQIASARAGLARAEANLANLLEGAAPERVAAAEAQVEQARIQLADAEDRLAETALTAPFDGVVTALHVEVGEIAGGLAVEMVDTGSLEVVLDVDEVDIGSIARGQQTIITLEAWPDRELAGEVTAIAPKAQSASGLASYQVHISLDTAGLPVRTGMTANADLITSRRGDALLVENKAITADRETGLYYVYRVEGDRVEKVEIAVGLRDRRFTEVLEGLREGDRLVLDYAEESLSLVPGRAGPFGR